MTISHIVLIRWAQSSTASDRVEVEGRVRELPRLIEGIDRLHDGPNVSPESLGGGFDWGFVITFRDVEARDVYLTHPAHIPVADLIGRASERVLVFDL
ncbi:Dabb family protein [Microbacterium sp. NPDC089318]